MTGSNKQRRVVVIGNPLVLIGGIVLMICVFVFFIIPGKAIKKIIVNSVSGVVLLWLANVFGAGLGISLPYTVVTVMISGILGVPGVLALILVQFIP